MSLRVNEIYLSIQGESRFAGLPCVFVRTTGCPLRCVWCDTAYAFDEGDFLTQEETLDRVLAFHVPLVEITGGEPLAQEEAFPLMTRLCESGKTLLLETSGALDITRVDRRVHIIMDIKCPGSGEAGRVRWENIALLKSEDEVKFVLAGREDYEFAKRILKEHDLARRCSVTFSPAFGRVEPRQVTEWILADRLPVRFGFPIHKFIWPPDMRGV